MSMKIDSGSGGNTIAASEWDRMQRSIVEGSVTVHSLRRRPDRNLVAYGGNPIIVRAQFEAVLKVVGQEENPLRSPRVETFMVCEGTTTSLMGRRTAEELKLLKVGPLEIDQIEGRAKPFPTVPNFVVSFNIDKNATGHADMALRIPLAYRKDQLAQLLDYEERDIIERVPPNTNPKFISAQFFVPKSNGTRRLVNDNKEVNKAITRVKHSMPTLEEFLPNMVGHDTFSIIDIKDAFLHLPLDDKSKDVTAFNTPKGLYRYKRLPFGITASPEIFQSYMDQHFKGLPGVNVFMDDIIIGGKGREQCKERTGVVLQKVKEQNLTLGTSKCKYYVEKVEFLGMVLDKTGLHPTYNKIEALKCMNPPKKVSELRGYFGLLNFFHSFFGNLQEKTKTMRTLLKKNADFLWTPAMQSEFDETRNMLSAKATRKHFSDKAQTTIITDASQHALGAIMTQPDEQGKERMVMCASRAVTPTEANYGQNALEALAVVWALEKWSFFTLGRRIIIKSDASALQFIYNHASTSKREMTRARVFALKLSPFDFVLEQIAGLKNPADPLSRLSVPDSDDWNETTEVFHIQSADLKWKLSVGIDDVRQRTHSCKELQQVLKALVTKQWDKEIIPYKHFENEMANSDGLLIRGSRIVPPVQMREEILNDAHKLHPGIVTMKKFIRLRAWWPGMDADIEKLVKSCYSCIINAPPKRPLPLLVPYAAQHPWELVAIDLHSHQPDKNDEEQSPFDLACKNKAGAKRNLLVIIDSYSRFIKVFPMKNGTGTEQVKALLQLTFSFFGTPIYMKMDNGPPFNGAAFLEFLEELGIEPVHSTPLWPQMNAQVERVMSTINDRLRKANIDDHHWEAMIIEFNRRYNEWPHSSTGLPPFEMFMHREARLPMPSVIERDSLDDAARDNEQRLKMQRKMMTDKKRKALASTIKAGDVVVLQASASDKKKINTTYSDELWTVLSRNDTEVKVQSLKDPSNIKTRSVNACKEIPQEALAEGQDTTINGDCAPLDDSDLNQTKQSTPVPLRAFNLRPRDKLAAPQKWIDIYEATSM